MRRLRTTLPAALSSGPLLRSSESGSGIGEYSVSEPLLLWPPLVVDDGVGDAVKVGDEVRGLRTTPPAALWSGPLLGSSESETPPVGVVADGVGDGVRRLRTTPPAALLSGPLLRSGSGIGDGTRGVSTTGSFLFCIRFGIRFGCGDGVRGFSSNLPVTIGSEPLLLQASQSLMPSITIVF